MIRQLLRKSYFVSQRMITPKPIGLKRFLQVEISPESIHIVRNDALNAAQTAEKKAADLFSKISKNPLATQMIIPIVTTNKQEQPSLKINYKNVQITNKLENFGAKKEGIEEFESFFEIIKVI